MIFKMKYRSLGVTVLGLASILRAQTDTGKPRDHKIAGSTVSTHHEIARESKIKQEPIVDDDEKFELELLNNKILNDKLNLIVAQDKLNDDLATMKALVAQVYKAHNVDVKEQALCGGISEGTCADAPKDDIVFKKRVIEKKP